MINKKTKAQKWRRQWITLSKFRYIGPMDYNFKVLKKAAYKCYHRTVAFNLGWVTNNVRADNI